MNKDKFHRLIELADKKYANEVIKIASELKKQENDIIEKKGMQGLRYSTPLVSDVLNSNLSAIKRKLEKKLEVDLALLASDPLPIEVIKLLYSRLKELADFEKQDLIEKLECKYKKYIRDNDYIKIEEVISSHLEGKDTELKIMYEKRFDKDKLDVESKAEVLTEITAEIDYINRIMKIICGEPLFKIVEQRAISDLINKCDTEEEFNTRISSLNGILQWLNDDIFKINEIEGAGPINKLESLLEKVHPKYDSEIIKNFRKIIKLRRKYPIHTDSQDFIDTAKELEEEYANIDWGKLWRKCRKIFLEGLRRLRVNLMEIRKIGKTSKIETAERILLLNEQGMRIWETIFSEMGKGCTPISSFMGRHSDFLSRDEQNQQYLVERWKEFEIFIATGLVTPCKGEKELDRHYDRQDLLKWQSYLKSDVVFKLSARGSDFISELSETICKNVEEFQYRY